MKIGLALDSKIALMLKIVSYLSPFQWNQIHSYKMGNLVALQTAWSVLVSDVTQCYLQKSSLLNLTNYNILE